MRRTKGRGIQTLLRTEASQSKQWKAQFRPDGAGDGFISLVMTNRHFSKYNRSTMDLLLPSEWVEELRGLRSLISI
jgi:hypothetical protein